MVRLYRVSIFVFAAIAAYLVAAHPAYAQTDSPLLTPTPRADASASATTSTTTSVTTTATISDATISDSAQALPTPTPAGVAATIEAEPEPLEGTIIANRTQSDARFFVEGMTYVLPPGESQGLDLPRSSNVLNLFSCDAALAESTPGCFWDPYIIRLDGFYEIYATAGEGSAEKLLLQEVGAPPGDQVWLQNRTGRTESVVFKNEVYELPPTNVVDFPVSTGVPAILYVRNCISVDSQSVCEWNPKTLDAGVFYAMLEVETPGSEPGSVLTVIDVRPVVSNGEEPLTESDSPNPAATTTAGVAATAPGTVTCQIVVPALNIRSGPGLQYDIIGKVRATEGTVATVAANGRSADSQWLTVAEGVDVQGWITASDSFITCQGDITSLPLVEAPAPPPTPIPVVTEQLPATNVSAPPAEPSAEAGTSADTEANAEPAPTEDTGVAVPPGQAVLVVNNGFQHQMRFTLDQKFRPQEGPSEYDLEPGGSVSIVVFPGQVPFTASSPWSGLSGNAELQVEADQTIPLWLRFEQDDSGSWELHWE